MTATFQGYLLSGIRFTLAVAILLSFATGIHAAEIYTPGIYVNSANGDQFIVSGANESNGRTLWTVVSAHNSSNYFSGIWETGPAIGNSILAGSSNIVTYPNGYGAGRSYGVIGSTGFYGWYSGTFLAAAQAGNTISLSRLNGDGSTWDQFTITLVTPTGGVASTSEQYVSGIYRNQNGYGFLVSGVPSKTGRTLWTIVSLPDNSNIFNASWETGAAVGNTLLAGSSNISHYSEGYAAGRSYGIMGSADLYGWGAGNILATAQAGNTISLSRLNSDGSTWAQFVLVKDNSSSVSYGTGSENYSAGYYRSQDGKRYLVSGSSEARGRTLWTIASVSMPTKFNASWETGAALGNSLLYGSSNISHYFEGYAAGRSYGVTGSTDLYGWGAGNILAAAQAGNTISLSRLNSDGSTWDQLVLTREPGTVGVTGTDTEIYIAGTDYQDVQGRTYTVSALGNIWSITGTGSTNFNAQWEPGPATTNVLLAGSPDVTNYPNGYLAGRSYGVIGSTGFYGWYSGTFLAAAQAGNTISLSRLNGDGSTWDEFLITKGGTGGVGDAGALAFASASYYVNKFDGKAIIGVTRTDGGTGMVSVTYSTADGTAHSGTDYAPASGGVLAWDDGDTATKFININIPATATGGRNFTITLNNPVGGALIGHQKTSIVTIFDNITNLLPHTYTLSLKFDPLSTGSGYVTITPPGTVCNTDYQAQIASQTLVTLTKEAAQYSLFAGWYGGGCHGTGDCSFTLSGDTTVSATFNLDTAHMAYNPGTAKYYSTLQAAYDAALDGATIQAWGMQYTESLNCGQAKKVTFKGGYDQGYTTNSGYTRLNGPLTIRKGAVVADRILIK